MSSAFSEYYNLGNTATKLNNGDFIIWYSRRNGDEKQCFQIIRPIDSNYILRKQETVIDTGATVRNYLECSVLLSNNNVAVVYLVSSDIYFAIYDENGNVIKSAADTGQDLGISRGTAIAALTGGGFCLCLASGGTGKFIIYDNSGTEIVPATNLTSEETALYDVSVTPLNNGNFFAAYNRGTNGSGEFVIFDAAGSQVKGATEFNDTLTNRFEATTTLSNDNVVLTYLDGSTGHCFVIYDEDGNLVKAETVFSNATTALAIDVKAAEDGGFYIAFADVNNSNYGTYIKYDSSGNIETAATVFEQAAVDLISIAGEIDSNIVIVYRDRDNSFYGEINLNGEEFAPPYDVITQKRMVAAAANTIWYEDI